MNNQVYFEINGTVATVADIPSQVLIVFLSKVEKKTKSGKKVLFKFYGISTSSKTNFKLELASCRMRAAAPMVVRDYIGAASDSDAYWRNQYDQESN